MKNPHIRLESVNLHYASVAFKERSLKSFLTNVFRKQDEKGGRLHDVHALKNINLEIRAGERIGLIGHNGGWEKYFSENDCRPVSNFQWSIERGRGDTLSF